MSAPKSGSAKNSEDKTMSAYRACMKKALEESIDLLDVEDEMEGLDIEVWLTKKEVLERAKSYQYLSDFVKFEPLAHKMARVLGIYWEDVKNIYAHSRWCERSAREVASCYKTVEEFRKGDVEVYRSAKRHGWLTMLFPEHA